ncbi:PA2928 family protein [Microbacterium murale]|uniref:PQQ-like domain-containing protein n=1 Tax=Microbacterium murale TaxID=1081040 RepID=A0ABU0P5M0_9MICO|nr:PA2928 family protein [Microbacterium murale]MDQ0642623.1 hypothetical protein [Microbacterium murale]
MKITTSGSGASPSSGYILNGSSVSFGSEPERPRPDRRSVKKDRRIFALIFLAPFVIGAVILFVGLFGSPSVRDIEVSATSAIVSMGAEEVAVVTYSDNSRPGLFESALQMRIAAIRMNDGEQLWDRKLNDDLIGDAVVLAGDAQWVYVGTDHGLVILDAASGEVHAEGTGIDGLGQDVVLAASAYGYDPDANTVMVLSSTGDILQIPVGQTRATPADNALASVWQGVLSASPWVDDSHLTETVGVAAEQDGTVYSIVSVAESVQRDALEVTRPEETSRRLAEFVDATILPVSGAAPRLGALLDTGKFFDEEQFFEEESIPEPAGIGYGFLLVQHRESINAERVLLSVVDAATGEIMASSEMQDDAVRALTGAEGGTAVISSAPEAWSANQLLILGADGTLTVVPIGALPWWLTLLD